MGQCNGRRITILTRAEKDLILAGAEAGRISYSADIRTWGDLEGHRSPEMVVAQARGVEFVLGKDKDAMVPAIHEVGPVHKALRDVMDACGCTYGTYLPQLAAGRRAFLEEHLLMSLV